MPGGNCCAIRGCHSRSGHGISLFSFPKDADQAELWLKACYRSDLLPKAMTLHISSFRLCELHFEKQYISKGSSKKRLFNNAIPSIFFTNKQGDTKKTLKPQMESSEGSKKEASEGSKKIHIISDILVMPAKDKENCSFTSMQPSFIYDGPSTSKDVICEPLEQPAKKEVTKISPPLFSPSAATQTPLQLSSNTPRKRKMKRQLKSLKKCKRIIFPKADDEFNIDEFKKMCDMFLDSPLNEIIKSHVTLKKKRRIQHRNSVDIKQFALTLYLLSPRAYNYLKKLLTLPAKRSLQRMSEQFLCKPGLDNKTIFKALELKTQTMLEQQKQCILCIDEMSIKSHVHYDIGKDEIVGLEDIGTGKKNRQYAKMLWSLWLGVCIPCGSSL